MNYVTVEEVEMKKKKKKKKENDKTVFLTSERDIFC
jgi:hypothetical protein